MEVTANLNYLRIAPRKVRLIADLIRRKKVQDARAILSFATKKGSVPLLKLLDQAIANAKNNFQLDPANLFVAKIKVDEGPKLKRWRARARGQAYEIQKKTSHISLVLDETVKGKRKKKSKKESVAPEAITPVKFKPPGEEGKPSSSSFAKARKIEVSKPKVEKGGGIKRIFRRKAF